jgi:hypothetical protein
MATHLTKINIDAAHELLMHHHAHIGCQQVAEFDTRMQEVCLFVYCAIIFLCIIIIDEEKKKAMICAKTL